jgi:hypothetical protein
VTVCRVFRAYLLLSGLMSLSLSGCARSDSAADAVAAAEAADAEASTAATPTSPVPATATEKAAEPDLNFIAPPLTPEEIEQGWISLFDGNTLFGWDVPTVSNWHVEDSAIVVDSGEKSLLLSPFEVNDFELRCDFYLAKGGNSGVFLRTADNAADPSKDTYELNICDSHPTHGSGSLVARFVAENVPAVEEAWHSFRVLCDGPHIQVWLDGTQIVDFIDNTEGLRLSGKLGLQMNQGRAAYRNVCLRPLKFQPLFNQKDKTGWKTVSGSKSEFTVTDGMIHVSNGPGFLETTDTFANFALKVTARINGDALNSGVFFRALEGTEKAPSHGYEMQLHNGRRDGNRSRPQDFGTGAIFRRVPARYVVADDREFFTAVLIADGDRFASWVNGYQVVNWKDERPNKENPREGRRLQAGHISLQGHDPTTDLDFRSIDLHALPE